MTLARRCFRTLPEGSVGFLVAVKHGTGATLPQGHPLRAALGLDVEREIWGWHISRSPPRVAGWPFQLPVGLVPFCGRFGTH